MEYLNRLLSIVEIWEEVFSILITIFGIVKSATPFHSFIILSKIKQQPIYCWYHFLFNEVSDILNIVMCCSREKPVFFCQMSNGLSFKQCIKITIYKFLYLISYEMLIFLVSKFKTSKGYKNMHWLSMKCQILLHT